MTDESKFHALLRDQVRSEFTASQQYLAIAVWLDDADLPQLAAHFYAQALEERNHAMMMIQFQMDNDLTATIPSVGEVQTAFSSVEELVQLALTQEKQVTEQITTLARTARDEGDYLGEQFLQWFLKEQVEEVASMTTLLTIVRRAGDDLFHIEDFVAREMVRGEAADPAAPPVAGGAL
ncbi:ferritin [Pseudonocardia sp. ICBG1293]|uniref:ferritin n=1 Tax=Pseudonocardia sp. ICBG1293 TaxID=2844382 RepID=UPI001CC99365|nr:ferritin [Pseudonocardia sp. ICBG1293]